MALLINSVKKGQCYRNVRSHAVVQVLPMSCDVGSKNSVTPGEQGHIYLPLERSWRHRLAVWLIGVAVKVLSGYGHRPLFLVSSASEFEENFEEIE
ncbi:hypothetical protein [Pantanalinema sp. GBBB05]|uniref:hypothetical protein n=1 Tax=Pantanalinema sp. GBBB05 TaxID=2604139 RepID=UPI001D99C7DF|nr:hypothetical protein [Pantanalinema sp. GBBB05]